jgi:ABC-type transport system involved in cytochrome bd biosynthesis fused ATPase/permease subunit
MLNLVRRLHLGPATSAVSRLGVDQGPEPASVGARLRHFCTQWPVKSQAIKTWLNTRGFSDMFRTEHHRDNNAAAQAPSPPALWTAGRKLLLTQITLLALCQALAAGLVALGVRGSFVALHDGLAMPVNDLLLIAAAGAAIALSRWGERGMAEKLGHHYANTVRSQLFVCLAHVTGPVHTTPRTRSLLTQRLLGDMGALRIWVSRGQVRMFSAAITLPVVLTLLMVWIHPWLALGVTLTAVLGVVVLLLMARGLTTSHRRLRSGRARLSAFVSERVMHAQELKLARRLGRERDSMNRHAQRLARLAVARRWRSSGLRFVPDVVRALAIPLVLATGFLTGTSAANVAATLAAVGLLMPALRDLALALDQKAAWASSRRRLWEVLATPAQSPQRMDKIQTESCDRNRPRPTLLRMLQVQVAALAPITHALPRGSKVVLQGPMGSGKSSLLRLLAGLVSANSGVVEYADPQNISQVDKRSRISIHYLGAHSILLSGSLRRNLTLGAVTRPHDDSIQAAVTAFGLEPLMQRLGGLQGNVSPSGSNLSTAEARRILLVRAMLCGADLVLIDDLDDLLDSEHVAPFEAWLASSPSAVVYASRDAKMALHHHERWQLNHNALQVVCTSVVRKV